MKTIFDHFWRIIVSSIVLYIIWIISMSVSENIIPSGLKTPDAPETLMAGLLYVVCLAHAIVLYILLYNTTWSGIRIISVVFSMIFFIQFFLSIVEVMWFNNSLNMPVSGQRYILFSGFLMSFTFSPLIVLISGKMKVKPDTVVLKMDWKGMASMEFLLRILILIMVIYPLIYNLAGYFIAWQFEAVRIFYTGSSALESFTSMFIANIKSGLYFFQIPRGLIWVILALPVYYSVDGSFIRKGVIIGLLFATLMNAQHLLPNPYFPQEVSFAHFIETYISNFLWGFSIAWILNWHPKKKHSEVT